MSEFERTFSEHQIPEDVAELRIPADALKENGAIWAGKLLTLAGMAGGTREARRLIEQGGVSLDGEKITDPEADVRPRSGQVLRVGRRRFARLKMG